MRTWQIVGLAVGMLVASVIAVIGLSLFILPGDTFDGPRAAIEGLEDEEGADGDGGADGVEDATDATEGGDEGA